MLCGQLFAAAPVLALEAQSTRDEGANVSSAKDAIAAASSLAEPGTVRVVSLHRAVWALPAPEVDLSVARVALHAHVEPHARGDKPPVVTCPSQGPPRAR